MTAAIYARKSREHTASPKSRKESRDVSADIMKDQMSIGRMGFHDAVIAD
jgi:hypothetical protein